MLAGSEGGDDGRRHVWNRHAGTGGRSTRDGNSSGPPAGAAAVFSGAAGRLRRRRPVWRRRRTCRQAAEQRLHWVVDVPRRRDDVLCRVDWLIPGFPVGSRGLAAGHAAAAAGGRNGRQHPDSAGQRSDDAACPGPPFEAAGSADWPACSWPRRCLASCFFSCRGYEWVRLLQYGLTLASGVYGATFYVLVGCHGVHVLGAVIWLSERASTGRASAIHGQVPCGRGLVRYVLVLRGGSVAHSLRTGVPVLTPGRLPFSG